MSKIGRKPIAFSLATIEVKGNTIGIKGPKGSCEYVIPAELQANVEGTFLKLSLKGELNRENKISWGLHRALLANQIIGIEKGFQSNVKIVGLGYKAQVAGKNLTLTLGYSHKIEYTIPADITITVDKSGQLLTVSGSDKALVGRTCDEIRSYKQPEPYKGTGIIRENEVVIRKAGKTKSAG